MNTSAPCARAACLSPFVRMIDDLIAICSRIPHSLVSLIGRFSIAAIFWKSGQTKVEGLTIDLVAGDFQVSWPYVSESALELFRSEYRLPVLPPEIAASMAVFGEHFFPILILLGLATRFSSLALLAMTLTIQIFVYPDAYPTHGVWTAVLLMLIARGPGVVSVDHWIRYRAHPTS